MGHSYDNIALGADPYRFSTIKFSRNPNCGTAGSIETIWNGSVLYPIDTFSTAQSLEVVATDANDTAAGTGARTGRLFGVDGNFNLQTADVTFNGLTPVAVPGTWRGVYRYITLSAGSLGYNAGDISFRVDGGGTEVLRPPAIQNTSFVSFITIPSGWSALVHWVRFNARRNSAGEIDFIIYAYDWDSGIGRTIDEVQLSSASPPFIKEFDGAPLFIPSRTHLEIRTRPYVNNMFAAASYGLTFIKGEYSGFTGVK